MDAWRPAADPAPSPHGVDTEPAARKPWRLLLAAVGWVLVAVVAQVCVSFLVSFVIGFQGGFARSRHGQPWIVPAWVSGLVAATAFQLALLFIAWRRGRVAAGGDSRRGLGIRPLRRPLLLAGLSAAIVPVVVCWVFVIIRFASPPSNGSLALAMAAAQKQGLTAQVGLLLVVGILAPVAEEWFFRGWLWTGLRRSWKPLPVMAATAGFWLLLHTFDGPTKLLYLVPAAIMVSVARHYCDSVRASLALHLVNNLAFLGIGLLFSAGSL